MPRSCMHMIKSNHESQSLAILYNPSSPPTHRAQFQVVQSDHPLYSVRGVSVRLIDCWKVINALIWFDSIIKEKLPPNTTKGTVCEVVESEVRFKKHFPLGSLTRARLGRYGTYNNWPFNAVMLPLVRCTPKAPSAYLICTRPRKHSTSVVQSFSLPLRPVSLWLLGLASLTCSLELVRRTLVLDLCWTWIEILFCILLL